MINQTREDSIATIMEMMAPIDPQFTEKDLIDWGIKGGETNAELEQMVHDYRSEMHTEMCAAKNAWRYQH